MSDDPTLPFGHNTLKLRAVFIPDGAQVPMSDITRVVGFDPVLIPAVFVPPGGAPPGYPYEIIGQATFIPDGDDRQWSTRTGPPRPGPQNNPAMPDNPMSQQPRGSGFPMARATGPWATGRGVAGDDHASDGARPRRGVRSTQASFSAAVPTPQIDTSHDAIGAAVRALNARPATWDYTSAASWAAAAILPGTAPSPSQFAAGLISAATADPVARSDAQPSQIVTDAAQERQPRTVDVASPPSDQGVPVILPDGATIPDPKSPTGVLMSPVADLAPVAAAGRQTGRALSTLKDDPVAATDAYIGFLVSIGTYLGHGGVFDYQRRGNHITGFVQLPQFRDVSNFNVGLFSQQAGLSLDEASPVVMHPGSQAMRRPASHMASIQKRPSSYGGATRRGAAALTARCCKSSASSEQIRRMVV